MKVRAARVGLTGGIGSGKSTVAAMFKKLGAEVIDADAISRILTAPRGAAIPDIAKMFGIDCIDSQGAMDREKIREIVYKDPAAKSRLENLLHPLVRKEMLLQASAAASLNARCVVFDIPLLVESGTWNALADIVLVVDCTAQTQSTRVKARNGLSQVVIETIMSTQARREDRLQAADIVLYNECCSMHQLADNVRQVAAVVGL